MSGGGLAASLRRLGGSAVELLHVRLELLATEIEEEKLRLFDALLLAGVAMLALGLGALLLMLFIVALAPERWRWLVLGTMALACLAGGAWAMLAARRRLQADGGLLRASRAELAQDVAALRPREGA